MWALPGSVSKNHPSSCTWDTSRRATSARSALKPHRASQNPAGEHALAASVAGPRDDLALRAPGDVGAAGQPAADSDVGVATDQRCHQQPQGIQASREIDVHVGNRRSARCRRRHLPGEREAGHEVPVQSTEAAASTEASSWTGTTTSSVSARRFPGVVVTLVSGCARYGVVRHAAEQRCSLDREMFTDRCDSPAAGASRHRRMWNRHLDPPAMLTITYRCRATIDQES